jgi:acyl dehydratase
VAERRPALGRIAVGEALGEVSLSFSLQRLAMVAGANRDFAPVHVSDAAARAGGAPGAYADVMFVFAMFERLVVEWGGPTTLVRRLGPIAIADFVVAGEEVTIAGEVVRLGEEVAERGVSHREVVVRARLSQGGLTRVTGEVLALLRPASDTDFSLSEADFTDG